MKTSFLSFSVVSGGGWLIDVAIAVLLVGYGFSPFIASVVGAGTAVTFVYILSRLVIFSRQKLGTLNDYAIYALWQVFAILAASFLVALIAFFAEPFASQIMFAGNNLSKDMLDPLAIATGIGKLLVTPFTLAANFLFIRWLANCTHIPEKPVNASRLS